MFLWPLHRFWTFTPWGWTAAVLWNVLERTNAWRYLPDGLPPWMFGVIIGAKGTRIG